MAFFDKLAQMLIDFIAGTWGVMKAIAGTVVNGMFGWYTGQTIDDTIAAIFVYGALLLIAGAWMFFGSALKFKN